MERNQWESAAEAILFALGEPVEETRLAQAIGCPREAAARACQSLAQGYEAEQAGVRLVRLEESWQLVSAPQWGETIRGLLSRRKPDKLSPAALETLAVVAYFQPVTREQKLALRRAYGYSPDDFILIYPADFSARKNQNMLFLMLYFS